MAFIVHAEASHKRLASVVFASMLWGSPVARSSHKIGANYVVLSSRVHKLTMLRDVLSIWGSLLVT